MLAYKNSFRTNCQTDILHFIIYIFIIYIYNIYFKAYYVRSFTSV